MIELSKVSPAARIAILREKYRAYDGASEAPQWTAFTDADLLHIVSEMAVEFAASSPNGIAWHFANILSEIGANFARPYQFQCQCGRRHKVNTSTPPDVKTIKNL